MKSSATSREGLSYFGFSYFLRFAVCLDLDRIQTRSHPGQLSSPDKKQHLERDNRPIKHGHDKTPVDCAPHRPCYPPVQSRPIWDSIAAFMVRFRGALPPPIRHLSPAVRDIPSPR